MVVSSPPALGRESCGARAWRGPPTGDKKDLVLLTPRKLGVSLGARPLLDGDAHRPGGAGDEDRKSTRLNSSHANISYAVFCLKQNNTCLLPSSAHTSAPYSLQHHIHILIFDLSPS